METIVALLSRDSPCDLGNEHSLAGTNFHVISSPRIMSWQVDFMNPYSVPSVLFPCGKCAVVDNFLMLRQVTCFQKWTSVQREGGEPIRQRPLGLAGAKSA